MLLYSEPSERGVPECHDTAFLLTIGVRLGLAPSILDFINKSQIYFDCERCKLGPIFVSSTLRK